MNYYQRQKLRRWQFVQAKWGDYWDDKEQGDKEIDDGVSSITSEEEAFYRAHADHIKGESGGSDSRVTVTDIDTGQEIDPERWIPFIGPRGGRGWKNTRTGKKRYQLRKPGIDFRRDEPPINHEPWRAI